MVEGGGDSLQTVLTLNGGTHMIGIAGNKNFQAMLCPQGGGHWLCRAGSHTQYHRSECEKSAGMSKKLSLATK